MFNSNLDPQPEDSTLIIARLGELFLKGRNQKNFRERLVKNLRGSLRAEFDSLEVIPTRGRIFVRLTDPDHMSRALEICTSTPGLTSASPCLKVVPDLEELTTKAVEVATTAWGGSQSTFMVRAKRLDKQFHLNSTQLGAHVGGAINDALGLPVDLKNADHVMHVELGERAAYIWIEVYPGLGGLPIGSAGKVLLMLSGGIDSPVAGHLAQKRGCEVDAIYFHSPPFISEASREKVESLAKILGARQGSIRLHVVPFTEIQKQIHSQCDRKLTVLLYRRFMYRIASKLASIIRAKALCTGENLAQVASQTLENLNLVHDVSTLLTMRPLLTYDKTETVHLAKRIGTYDISIQPYDDCCSLFLPRNPATRGRISVVRNAESLLDVD
ncbi:MAG: tRNA uracil 4-sulfurtransferase ThiI, partial [Myxococcota bacterium]|nr:tRNA uracil 4-sulfurtransferase ThiI [Myxococcota bacterium]